MKVAVLFKGSYDDPKGYFNSVRNRIKYLSQIADFRIDVYLIQVFEPWYIRFLRGTKRVKKVDSVFIDGLRYKISRVPFSLIDYLLRNKLNYRELISESRLRKIARTFSHHDLIVAHSLECAIVASRAHFLYNIPYFVTWHGCDINNDPFINRFTRIATVKVLREATKNFFVSKALFEASDKLVKEISKAVLYNGVSDEFTAYPVYRKELLKIKHNVPGIKVVAFVGGIVEEKNIFSLPGIFKNISSFRDVVFWIIGDGKYRKSLEKQCISMNLNVRFFGNQSPALIPELMNCIDVLILPSYREGMPLVIVEALACGCAVFGSRVGGIPEAIGIENTFELNDDFENNLSAAVTEFLATGKMRNQTFDREKYSWKASAQSELAEINNVLVRDSPSPLGRV